MLTFFYYC